MKKTFVLGLIGMIVLATQSPAQTQRPFAVQVDGATDSPIVFIPGLCCDGAVWKETVQHFKKNHECHVLTLAGFAGQKTVEGPFMEPMAKAIVTYIKEKKLKKPLIVGHSLGASLALSVAIEGGDAIGGAVAVDGYACSVALFMPNATSEEIAEFGRAERTKIEGMSREDHLKSVNEMFAQWAEGERLELCKSWIAKSDQKTVARAKGELFSLDLRPKLKQVPCPTVLLAGYNNGLKAYFKDRAEFETRVGEQLKNAPGSRAVVHPDSRHFIMWDQPAWLHGQIEQTLKSFR